MKLLDQNKNELDTIFQACASVEQGDIIEFDRHLAEVASPSFCPALPSLCEQGEKKRERRKLRAGLLVAGGRA